MKYALMIFLLFFLLDASLGQENNPETPPGIDQQIEDQAGMYETETEDDSYLQQLEYYKKHPVNFNEADANELREFKMLTDLQIQHFILYRNLLGALIHIYELQAIPTWDILTIRKLIPYIIIADTKTMAQNLRRRFLGGDKSLMLRFSMVLPRSKGYFRDSSANFYTGSRPHMLVRSKYNYKNLLQYGLLGDKDAGEQFFKGSQKLGFDFYSFHFFARKLGMIKQLAIGDFTVNLGQGLIHWQSLAFKKNAAIVSVKRQTDILRPYTSAGEYNFHRGAGITLGKKSWETTVFASTRKLSAIIKTDSLQNQEGYVSSLLKSGYNRSHSELEDRNNLRAVTLGSNIKYSIPKGHTGISWVQYFFSKPFKASDKPYDMFAIEGKKWSNFSLDYAYTFRNIHLFGEMAADTYFHTAFLQGFIVSIDRSVDVAMVYRKIDKRYQSVYGNAFTENNLPGNETGVYTGISMRAANVWKIDAYADFYKFPWLLYRADAPGYGSDYLLQAAYIPNKQVEISLRYKKEAKQSNAASELSISPLVYGSRRNLRYQISYRINREISIKNRVEALWYEKEAENKQKGFLIYADIYYRSYSKPFSGNTRLQFFESDGYSSRLYAYENDVLYSYSMPAFFNKGFRWYLNVRTDLRKWLSGKKHFQIELWLKYALTHYFELDKIGSHLDEIQGNRRSEFKIQLFFSR